MKQLSQKILETGIIDESTTHLLSRWGLSGADKVAKRGDLTAALTEIERLVGRELGAYRQCVWDIDWTKPGVTTAVDADSRTFTVRWDLMGRMVVKRRENWPHLPKEGDKLTTKEGATYKILAVDRVYTGEDLVAVLCEVE